MNGPRKDVSPSALWLKLSARPRPMTEIDFPAKYQDGTPIGRCKLRILSENELAICRAQADQAAKKIMGAAAPKAGEVSFGYEDIYRNESVLQTIALACRDADDPQLPVFQRPQQARETLTTDEMAVLLVAYNAFRTECGPIISETDTDQLEAYVRVLKEGGSRVPLANCSGELLTDLVMYLVSKLPKSSIAIGSAGSPADAQSTETVAASDNVADTDVAIPE